MQTQRLNDGNTIPQLGFGVYQTPPGDVTKQAVLTALAAGYRHIDTAQYYGNEQSVGQAIRESGLRRGEVFVTTKLANHNQGYKAALNSFDSSLEALGFDYVDLFLVHFPVPKLRQESWRALVELHRAGKARSIGVSNYTTRHLQALLVASDVVPAVNQVEMSPFCTQRDLRAFCKQNNIVVQAYSPLTQGKKLTHPTVMTIAAQHQRSPAQVMLRWAVQQDAVVLPKSVTPERIRENAAIFDFTLDEESMHALDALHENFRTCWDPTDVP